MKKKSALFWLFPLWFSSAFAAVDPTAPNGGHECLRGLIQSVDGRGLYVPSLSTAYDYLNDAHFDKQPFPQRNMGKITDDLQFVIDGEFLQQLEMKQRLLQFDRPRIFKTTDDTGVNEASRELLDILVELLPRAYPTHYVRDGAFIVNRINGERWNVVDLESQEDPLVIASRLVQEDLTLVKERDDGNFYLVGGVLAFPSHWSLDSMMGKTMDQIHAHAGATPKAVTNLNHTINGMLRSMKPDSVILRNNWLLWDDPTLPSPDYRHSDYPVQKITRENVGADLFLRSERQTLRKLPKSGFIVFTLHTYIFPMKDVASIDGVSERFLGGLRRMEEEEGAKLPEFHSILKEYFQNAVESHTNSL